MRVRCCGTDMDELEMIVMKLHYYLVLLKVKCSQEVDGQMVQKKTRNQNMVQEELVFLEHLVEYGSDIQNKQKVVELKGVAFLVDVDVGGVVIGADVDASDLALGEFLV